MDRLGGSFYTTFLAWYLAVAAKITLDIAIDLPMESSTSELAPLLQSYGGGSVAYGSSNTGTTSAWVRRSETPLKLL